MKFLLRLVAFGAIATSLASCGRATYSANSKMPLPDAARSMPVQQAYRPVGADSTASIVIASASLPSNTLPRPNPGEAAATVARPSKVLPAAPAVPKVAAIKAAAPTRPAHTSFVQKLVLKRMATQLRKVQAARQNVAQLEKGQAISKVGRAAIIALIGAVLVAIVIGASANSVETATGLILLGIIGYALLVTGIVLLVISLVNG